MTSYRVTWEIDIDADTPTEAAQLAQDWLRDVDTMATVFEVTEHAQNSKTVIVDLKE